MADVPTALRVRVHGRVQGVWFRGWTIETATALGLRGWVRNRRDGTVEALLIGAPAVVEEMARRCHEGPSYARVTRVDRAAAADDGAAGFSQQPTV